MKIELSTPGDISKMIRLYSERGFVIDGQDWHSSIAIVPEQTVQHWEIEHYADIAEQHIQVFVDAQPELILIGTGKKIHPLDDKLLSIALRYSIGIEIMDSGAACRCHNLLLEEGRRVCTGLLLPNVE